MAGQGVQHLPIRYPREMPAWMQRWFDEMFRDVFRNMDIRNATPGLGISIEGTPDRPATISATEDLGDLFDADFLLAESDPALLPNARTLGGESGVVDVADSGPGGSVTVGLVQHGVPTQKLRLSEGCSVLGNAGGDTGEVNDIIAGADATVLARVDGVVRFTKVSPDMIDPPITSRYLVPVTNGDPDAPDLLFDDAGDLVFADAETF